MIQLLQLETRHPQLKQKDAQIIEQVAPTVHGHSSGGSRWEDEASQSLQTIFFTCCLAKSLASPTERTDCGQQQMFHEGLSDGRATHRC